MCHSGLQMNQNNNADISMNSLVDNLSVLFCATPSQMVNSTVKHQIDKITTNIQEWQEKLKALRFAHISLNNLHKQDNTTSDNPHKTICHQQTNQPMSPMSHKQSVDIIFTKEIPLPMKQSSYHLRHVQTSPDKQSIQDNVDNDISLPENCKHLQDSSELQDNNQINQDNQDNISFSIEEEQQRQLDQIYEQYSLYNQYKSIGMILYQKYILFALALFALLTLVSIPAMLHNYQGNGIQSTLEHNQLSKVVEFILKLSNANQNSYNEDKLQSKDVFNIASNKLIIVFTDIVNISIIFVWILLWRVYSANYVQRNLEMTPKPFMYALEAVFEPIYQQQEEDISHQEQDKLPEKLDKKTGIIDKIAQQFNTNLQQQNLNKQNVQYNNSEQNSQITQNDIHNCLSPFGKIAQISPVRRYSNFIHLVQTLVKSIRKQSKIRLKTYDQTRKAQIYKTLQKQYINVLRFYLTLRLKRSRNDLPDEQIQQIELNQIAKITQEHSHQEIPIKSTIVVFENIEDRKRVEQLYTLRIVPQMFVCNKGNTRFKMTLESLRTNPLNINWENYHFRDSINRKRFICQCCVLFSIVCMVVIGFFLISVNKLHISNFKHLLKHSHSSISDQISSIDQLYNFWQNTSTQQPPQQQLQQLCNDLSNSKLLQQYYEFCVPYLFLSQQYISMLLMFLFSLLIFFINLLTSKILRAMVLFRRYKTVAEKDQFLIVSMTFFSLLNSAFIIVVIRHHFTGPWLASLVSDLFSLRNYQAMEVEYYAEFSRKWHIAIGSQLIVNFALSLILMPHSYLLMYWIRKRYRERRQSLRSILAQRKQFDYCLFYTLSLKSYVFCLAYSNTMPVFYPLALLSFTVQYFIRKLALRNMIIEPLFLDSRANEVLTNHIQLLIRILPFGLILHIITSYFFFQVEQIFPNLSLFNKVFEDQYEILGMQCLSQLRLEKRSMFLIIAIFMCILLIYRKEMMTFLSNVLKKDTEERSKMESNKDQTGKTKLIEEMDHNLKLFNRLSTKLDKTILQSNREQQAKNVPNNSPKITQTNITNPKNPSQTYHPNPKTQKFTQILKNPSQLSSFMMQDHPRYKTIKYAMNIVEQHANQLLQTQPQSLLRPTPIQMHQPLIQEIDIE